MVQDAGVDAGVGFEEFFVSSEPAIRRALVAGFGGDLGREATAEALAYGWREWARLSTMANPAGYLYRVGQRWARRNRPRATALPDMLSNTAGSCEFEPGLRPALEGLTRRQRQAVVLVVRFGLSHADAASLLGLSRSSIQNHVERAMSKLREHLGATQ